MARASFSMGIFCMKIQYKDISLPMEAAASIFFPVRNGQKSIESHAGSPQEVYHCYFRMLFLLNDTGTRVREHQVDN